MFPSFFLFFESGIKIEMRDTRGQREAVNCFKEKQCVANEGVFEGTVGKFRAPERKYSESCYQGTSFGIAIVQKTSVMFAPALFHEVLYI